MSDLHDLLERFADDGVQRGATTVFADALSTVGRRRMRRRGQTVLATALLVLSASGGIATIILNLDHDGNRVRTVDTRPTATSAIPRSTTEACTQTDLDQPPLAMPAPRRITTPILFRGSFARLDPAPDAQPSVAAPAAWSTLSRNAPIHARSVELLLGYYSSIIGPRGAQSHVLAWVVRVQHLANTFQPGPAPAGFGATSTTQPPVCVFTDAYFALNATTGTGIVDHYGS